MPQKNIDDILDEEFEKKRQVLEKGMENSNELIPAQKEFIRHFHEMVFNDTIGILNRLSNKKLKAFLEAEIRNKK